MKKHIKHWAIGRDSRAAHYFGVLFGTAVFTILAIRGFLAITGYPQLGGDSLHIAHMLWGGLFMLVAIILLLYVHGHRAKIAGSFIGGIGFGFFIDELGKFITNDNDYFYQPAAMLIYIIFLLLWALFEWLDNYSPVTPHQQYIDMLTRLRDASIHGMTSTDKQYIQNQYNQLGILKSEQNMLNKQLDKYAPPYQPNSFVQTLNAIIDRADGWLHAIVKNKVTPMIIYTTITVSALASLAIFILAVLQNQNLFDFISDTPVGIEVGLIAATALSIVCVAIGFTYSRRQWRMTLVWYRRAMVVNVFGTQVFLFYINQFTATFGLAFSLLMLYVLTIQVKEDNGKKHSKKAA